MKLSRLALDNPSAVEIAEVQVDVNDLILAKDSNETKKLITHNQENFFESIAAALLGEQKMYYKNPHSPHRR